MNKTPWKIIEKAIYSCIVGVMLYISTRMANPLLASAFWPTKYQAMLEGSGMDLNIPNFLSFCLLYPIFEEYLFRVVLVNKLKMHMPLRWAIVISLGFFVAFHWRYVGTPYIISTILLGLICQTMVTQQSNFLGAAICHCVFNFMVIIDTLNVGKILGREQLQHDVQIFTSKLVAILIVSLGLLAIVMRKLRWEGKG